MALNLELLQFDARSFSVIAFCGIATNSEIGILTSFGTIFVDFNDQILIGCVESWCIKYIQYIYISKFKMQFAHVTLTYDFSLPIHP